MLIRRLTFNDAEIFKALRIQATQESPASFYPSHEEESAKPIDEFRDMLSIDSINIVLGAFNDEHLVGIAGLRRETLVKTHHKATLWGMYCTLHMRRRGIAKQLIESILIIACNTPELKQIKLAVHTENVAAKKLYESFGFLSYGIEPNSMKINERFFHEELMALSIQR